MAKQLHVSWRHLARRFGDSIGTSPKTFARVVRVQRALAMRRRGWGWAAIAQELGCVDQAHLTKEFRSVTSLPPERLVAVAPQSDLSRYFYAGRDLSHFYNTAYL